MILDRQALFCDGQDIGLTAQTVISTHTIDLGAVAPTIPGVGGSPLTDQFRVPPGKLFAQVVEAVASAGAATVQVELIGCTGSDGTGTIVVYSDSGAIALASLVAGYKFPIRVPEKLPKRYMALRITIGAATTTAGTLTAGFAMDTSSAHPLGG